MTIKKLRAPIRIDFAGGTTDIEPFASRYGGAVLNAGINKYVEGELVATSKKVSLEYHANIPTSSGLGTSSVMNVIWLALISQKNDFSKKGRIDLAEGVYKLEQSMGLIGGKQDEYAAVFGGINFLEFIDGKVKVTQLKLKKDLIKKLEDSLILVYTGEHFSGDANKMMIQNLSKKAPILKNLSKIARDMKSALLKGDLEKFKNLMDKETEERSKLSKKVITPKMKKYIEKGKKLGASAKICGSGNGGSLLFFGDKKLLKKNFKNTFEFKFDWEGLKKI